MASLHRPRCACLWNPAHARAQTDEIQVYDGELTAPGKFNLTWHNNFTPNGAHDACVSRREHRRRVVQRRHRMGVGRDAVVRSGTVFAAIQPRQESTEEPTTASNFVRCSRFRTRRSDRFFYGANFEFSINQKNWDENHSRLKCVRLSAGT